METTSKFPHSRWMEEIERMREEIKKNVRTFSLGSFVFMSKNEIRDSYGPNSYWMTLRRFVDRLYEIRRDPRIKMTGDGKFLMIDNGLPIKLVLFSNFVRLSHLDKMIEIHIRHGKRAKFDYKSYEDFINQSYKDKASQEKCNRVSRIYIKEHNFILTNHVRSVEKNTRQVRLVAEFPEDEAEKIMESIRDTNTYKEIESIIVLDNLNRI
jgi:hypothetical protein